MMAEKPVQPRQRRFGFSITKPVVSRRIDIQIEVERAAEPNAGDWIHIRWRMGETSDELMERFCRWLVGQCVPQPVWTDNGWDAESRRKGASGDGR
jgi:hypothetical protein